MAFDLFVSHPICDAARNLAAIWGAQLRPPLSDPLSAAEPELDGKPEYLRHEYDRMRRVVQEVAGRQIGDDDLRNSIAVFNENRRLLRDSMRSSARRPG